MVVGTLECSMATTVIDLTGEDEEDLSTDEVKEFPESYKKIKVESNHK